jgi:hypothetical protein
MLGTRLLPHTILRADQAAEARQAIVRPTSKHVNNLEPDPVRDLWQTKFGFRCELALQPHIPTAHWTGEDAWRKDIPDYEDFIDVKGIHKPHHCLIIQKDAHDDWAYVAVYGGRHPSYRIWGWLWGREGKRPEWWEDKSKRDRPAFFVPNKQPLRPISELCERLMFRRGKSLDQTRAEAHRGVGKADAHS